jgi:hypothetical protein
MRDGRRPIQLWCSGNLCLIQSPPGDMPDFESPAKAAMVLECRAVLAARRCSNMAAKTWLIQQLNSGARDV